MLEGDYLRRGVAEFVGTFALIFVGAGAVAFARTPTDVALAHGLVIAVMVSAVGMISGGHFNPAVTLGFLVTNRISRLLAAWYWLVQFSAAAAAALVLRSVLPADVRTFAHLGAPGLGSHVGVAGGVVIEAILTFFLVWVVFATAVDPRGAFQQIAGLAIGFTIALDILFAGGLTGAAMNPARAFGPQLVARQWSGGWSGHWWIWYVGPAAGAVIAACLYEMLYLRRPEAEPAPADATAA